MSLRKRTKGTLTLRVNSITRKETSTYKGLHSTSAAWFSYLGVAARVRVPLFATQGLRIVRRGRGILAELLVIV